MSNNPKDRINKHNWVEITYPISHGHITLMACTKCGVLLGDNDSDVCNAIILTIEYKFFRDRPQIKAYDDINRFFDYLSNKAMKLRWKEEEEDNTEISLLINQQSQNALVKKIRENYLLISCDQNKPCESSLYGFKMKLVKAIPENIIGVYDEKKGKFIAYMNLGEQNDSQC